MVQVPPLTMVAKSPHLPGTKLLSPLGAALTGPAPTGCGPPATTLKVTVPPTATLVDEGSHLLAAVPLKVMLLGGVADWAAPPNSTTRTAPSAALAMERVARRETAAGRSPRRRAKANIRLMALLCVAAWRGAGCLGLAPSLADGL